MCVLYTLVVFTSIRFWKCETKYLLILRLVPCIVFEGEDGVIPEKIQLVAEKTKNEISLKSFPVVGGG